MKTGFSLDEICSVLPEATADLLVRVAETASSLGVRIHIVGGPVRDLLLERSLVDVDLLVEGAASGLAAGLIERSAEGEISVVAHDRFGTVRVENAEASLDLATLRHETYAHPGALPDVVSGTLEQDAHRRDFSINALHCPLDGADPTRVVPIVDLVGGLEDLAVKRLRVLHSRSFHDDPTRAWRAARFGARLGLKLDRSSRAALRSALRDGAFGAVSGERFRREFQLAVNEAHQGTHAGKILKSLSEWHVLSALEPGLSLARDRGVPLRRLSKAMAEPEWAAPRWQAWVAALSIWLAPLPAALRRRTLERFSVRGDQAARIIGFGRNADRTIKSLTKARGRGAVDATLGAQTEESIQALYALADVPVRRRMLRWGAEDRRRRAPVNGADLLEVGLQGPEIGKALERIRAGFLEGDVANREEALALAAEMALRSSRRSSSPKPRKSRRKVAPRDAIADTPDVVDGGKSHSSE